ncbi:uncharacterized protein N7484_010016 [Penicillium longicatenatum]|uniref:uncharacterized protein n=1 Tax=Penicillium longicatenatum TaxID=1561947 RepID=UPI0025470C43|nr:uncharacterized protein N7484_010016 [Penicillium longicatenatum]KAJ5636703.1 hypothetical protein N7484_010016 [Penicillium longicatenatum]
MATPRITLYFDIGSPFSQIGFHVLRNSPIFTKCQIDYVPVLLRDLFQKCNNTPPIAVKNKLQWIQRERLYWGHRFGVPITAAVPEGFPASTIDIQTTLCALAKEAPEKFVSIIEKFYYVFWAEADTKIASPERFFAVLENELGQELTKKIQDTLVTSDVKAALLENTQRAFDAGAFGLPWFECVNTEGIQEGFWGIDHLGRLADFLQLDTSLDQSFRVLL